jgi:hypothetical protein
MRAHTRGRTSALLTTVLLLSVAACAGSPPADTATTASATPASGSSPAPAAAPAPASSPEPTAVVPTPAAIEPAAPAFDGTVVEVSFAGGEVTTAQPRVTVPLGSQVRMVVTSDAVDEVHVHGVDEYVALAPGAPVTHDFTASIPGIFEVELHEAGDLLLTLQVEP